MSDELLRSPLDGWSTDPEMKAGGTRGGAESTFVWEQPFKVGDDCVINAAAKLIIRSDGTANWIARGWSSDSNDTLQIAFYFEGADHQPTFPPITVPWMGGVVALPQIFPVAPLVMSRSNQEYDWGSGFIFPAEGYARMMFVRRYARG